MGRRHKGGWVSEFNEEPLPNIDTTNKVFIETPILLTIGKAAPIAFPSNPHQSYNGSSRVNANSPIRLESSRDGAVCPNPPATVEYELSERPTWKEIDEYISECKCYGFGRGTIVARRYASTWRQTNPTEWGMITYITRQPTPTSGPFKGPFNVKWFDFGGTPKEERAWAEDLLVIHAALDDDIVKAICENQGVTIP